MRIPLTALLLLLAAAWAQAVPLGSTRAVRELDRDTAAKSLPVRLEGVVTFCVPSALGGFVLEQDGTGLWIGLFSADSSGKITTWAQDSAAGPPTPEQMEALRETLRQLKPGMALEVTGITVPGGFAPSIAATHLRLLPEAAALPAAAALDPARFTTGMLDCQRVMVEGVVQELLPSSSPRGQTQFMLAMPGRRFRFTVWEKMPWAESELIGARVRAEAVCGTVFNERGETVSVFLQASSFGSWSLLEKPPADAFAAPQVQAGQMLPFRAAGPVLTRQKVTGTFSYGQPGHFLILDTQARCVRINTSDAMTFQPGDVLEAAGFVELRGGFAEMMSARVRRVGSTQPPPVSQPQLAELFTGSNSSRPFNPDDFQNRLIALTGLFQHQEAISEAQTRLHFLAEANEFTALLPTAALADLALRPQSEVSVTGVCQLDSGTEVHDGLFAPVKAVTLLPRGVDDLRVLRQASWWTPRRLLIAFGLTAAVLALALLWAAQLRRLVTQRSAELAREITGREQEQVKFHATLHERQRMAADLHDGMEQTLNGLALQLQAAQKFLHGSPDRTQQHLDLSLSLLDSSRDELRRSVWDLRSEGLAGQTLPQALGDLIPQWIEGRDLKVNLQTEGEITPVPDHLASNLLMLVREALNNALKHGHAVRFSLHLRFEPQQLTLTLHDDGRGFDPARAPGPSEGHFGLQGMKERVARISGTLDIQSRPGQGTTLTVHLHLPAA